MLSSILARHAVAMTMLLAALPVAGQTVDMEFTAERMYDTSTVIPGTGGDTPSSFSDPGVDDDGNTGSETTLDAGVDAITAVIDGTLRTISIGGVSTLPGTAEVIGNHDDYFMISNSQVLFQARNIGATSDDAHVFGNHLGLEVVARENVTQVPDQPAGTTFDDLPNTEDMGTDGTRVIFVGRFSGTERGVYLYEAGARSTVVDTGDSFGGMPFNFLRDATVDGDGIVFVAERGGAAVTALFLYESGVLTELISTDDNVPGTGSLVTSIGEPDIDAGRVIIKLEGAGGEEGIYLIDDEGITLIVDLDTPLPGGPSASDIHQGPGIGGGFVGFRAERGNGSEAFVWHDGHIARVLSPGDSLDGQTVTSVGSQNRPFVADGFMALDVDFGNDFEAIYRFALEPIENPLPVPLLHTAPLLVLLLLVTGLFFASRIKRRA